MINGSAAHNKISQGGVVKKLLDEGMTPEQVIDRLYIRCLSRAPSEPEKAEQLVNDELRKAFNKAIRAIRKDGTYQQINEKYFPFDIY